MKFWWLLLLILPASIHIYDGEFLRFFQLLLWLMMLIFPAALFTHLGLSWSVARVICLPILAFLPYVFSQNFAFPLPSYLWAILFIISFYFLWQQRNRLNIDEVVESEKVFLITFVSILSLNAFHPALYWGEKPMDLSLLGYFLRLDQGPIYDPWAYMSELKYYALGYFSWALPAKAAALKLEQAYVYSLAAIAGLMAQAGFVFFSWLKKEWATRLALLIPFLGTLGILNSIAKHSIPEMSFFWSASRVFEFGHFTEYPLWSFLFADLHPHVMAYPLVILVMGGILKATFEAPSKNDIIVTGIALAILPWLNAWDFVLLAPLALIILASYGKKIVTKESVAATIGIAVMAAWIFFTTKSNSRPTSFSFAQSSGYIGIVLHLGLGFIAAILLLAQERAKRLVLLCSFLFMLALLTNHIVFMDRINTVFKFMTTLGTFFSLILLTTLALTREKVRLLTKTLIGLSLISSCLLIISISWQTPFPVKRPSLKGLSFLKYSLPSDTGIIEYLNNIEGTPLILEVPSKSFDYQAARISAYTGLPTWLGWDQHVVLRGKTWQQVSLRKRWVDGMYESTDAIRVHRELLAQNVEFIVVGPTEKTRYGAAGLEKFRRYPELFEHILDHYSASLYRLVTE